MWKDCFLSNTQKNKGNYQKPKVLIILHIVVIESHNFKILSFLQHGYHTLLRDNPSL